MKLITEEVISAHVETVIAPCSHEFKIPQDAYGGRIKTQCSRCHDEFFVEVVDLQGILTLKWFTTSSVSEDRAKALEQGVTALIEQFGLPDTYREVRSRPGFCSNCGTPEEPGQTHVPWGSLGACSISEPMDTGGGENNGG